MEYKSPDIKLTEDSQSYWIASTSKTNYPALDRDLKIDAVIIGGGLVGITTAFFLKQAGLKVAVVEANRICLGTTAHTTAKITSQHGLIYNKIKSRMGEELARQYADSNETAIKIMDKIIKEYDIDCDFCYKPAYVYTHQDKYIREIVDEAETASALGIKASFLEEVPLPFSIKAAVRFDNQAQFHPRKYLLNLAKLIPGEGSYIFEGTKALELQEGVPNIIKTNLGKSITADKVIIASHYPFYDGLGLYFTRLYAEKSYILGIKIKQKFPDGMFITAEEPGRSLRSQKFMDGELLLVAGEHHKTGHGGSTIKHYENLRDFAASVFDVEKILYRWSTQDCMTLDDIPYIGPLTSATPDIYVATGFKKWGMTTSMVSAILIKDIIVNGKSPWQEIYNPSRLNPGASAGKFIKENVDVAVNFISGKLKPLPDNVVINEGEAKIVEIDGKRVGAYRDESGTLYIVDITCTHLGCELVWNDAEKTWDCPCHGSRFSFGGSVVEGPAHKPLNYLNESPNKIDPNII